MLVHREGIARPQDTFRVFLRSLDTLQEAGLLAGPFVVGCQQSMPRRDLTLVMQRQVRLVRRRRLKRLTHRQWRRRVVGLKLCSVIALVLALVPRLVSRDL